MEAIELFKAMHKECKKQKDLCNSPLCKYYDICYLITDEIPGKAWRIKRIEKALKGL